MKMQNYLERIKLELTGGLLDLEVDDTNLQKIVNSSLLEIQRYINSTKIVTMPYQKCLDLSDLKISSVSKVFRANAQGTGAENDNYEQADPIQIGLWQLTSNMGNMYNFEAYAARYGAWSTIQQIGNTLSTDLAFYYDDSAKQLYVNTTLRSGSSITIEYVPLYENVEEVTSNYWIDQLYKMSLARTKIIVGRIRTRFTQSNALWLMDGETMLNEGNAELTALREHLTNNTALIYPID